MEAQKEVGPEENPRVDPAIVDSEPTQDALRQSATQEKIQLDGDLNIDLALPDQDPNLPVASSLPNLLHESMEPEQPPLRRSTRIRKPNRAMLEHLAAHCAGLDPSEIFVFADQMNEVILSVFAAATDNKAAIEGDTEDSAPINNKLTPRDVGYIPNGWVDAMNYVEREKWLKAAHIELKA